MVKTALVVSCIVVLWAGLILAAGDPAALRLEAQRHLAPRPPQPQAEQAVGTYQVSCSLSYSNMQHCVVIDTRTGQTLREF